MATPVPDLKPIMGDLGLTYACHLCDYRSPWKSYAKLHIQDHGKEKPYTCKECGMKFSVDATWNYHSLNHVLEEMQSNPKEKTIINKNQEAKKKKQKGSQAKKRMATPKKELLDTKKAVQLAKKDDENKENTPEQPVEIAFAKKKEQKINQQKDYSCNSCGLGFTDQKTLLEHLLMHAEEGSMGAQNRKRQRSQWDWPEGIQTRIFIAQNMVESLHHFCEVHPSKVGNYNLYHDKIINLLYHP